MLTNILSASAFKPIFTKCLIVGLEIVGGESGVKFLFSREGRPSGEGFVEFNSEADVQMAVKRHNEHMGQRYVEGMGCMNFVFSFLCKTLHIPTKS